MDSLLIETDEVRPQELKRITNGRQVFENVCSWFSGLLSLTEEEKKEAGLFVGDHQD